PLVLFGGLAAPLRTQFFGNFWRMIAIHTGLGLAFLLLAIAGLRPMRGSAYPMANSRRRRVSLLGLLRSIFRSQLVAPVLQNQILVGRVNRSVCGDRPMLWKERYIKTSGGLRWLSSPLVLIVSGVFLTCYLFDATQPVLAEIVRGSQVYR